MMSGDSIIYVPFTLLGVFAAHYIVARLLIVFILFFDRRTKAWLKQLIYGVSSAAALLVIYGLLIVSTALLLAADYAEVHSQIFTVFCLIFGIGGPMYARRKDLFAAEYLQYWFWNWLNRVFKKNQ